MAEVEHRTADANGAVAADELVPLANIAEALWICHTVEYLRPPPNGRSPLSHTLTDHDCLAQMICFKPADRSLDALLNSRWEVSACVGL